MASQELKTLKIKTGVCKRVLKELQSYELEVKRETAKTQMMKDNNADTHDLKQQENVLLESKMMIPDCRKRLETAFVQLKTALGFIQDDLEKEEDVTIARQLLTNVQTMLEVA